MHSRPGFAVTAATQQSHLGRVPETSQRRKSIAISLAGPLQFDGAMILNSRAKFTQADARLTCIRSERRRHTERSAHCP
jgi:hypothetical protein